jgi:hypothetical protein
MLRQLRHRLGQWLCPCRCVSGYKNDTTPDHTHSAHALMELELRLQTVEDKMLDLRDTPTPPSEGVDMDAHLGAN